MPPKTPDQIEAASPQSGEQLASSKNNDLLSLDVVRALELVRRAYGSGEKSREQILHEYLIVASANIIRMRNSELGDEEPGVEAPASTVTDMNDYERAKAKAANMASTTYQDDLKKRRKLLNE